MPKDKDFATFFHRELGKLMGYAVPPVPKPTPPPASARKFLVIELPPATDERREQDIAAVRDEMRGIDSNIKVHDDLTGIVLQILHQTL